MFGRKTLRVGAIVFPGFQALDLFGPLDALNVLSWSHELTLEILSSTLEPVTTKSPRSGRALGQWIVPTSTFDANPAIDVLVVPGGLGTRAQSPQIEETISYIRNVYPSLTYLITICTGSGLAARAGVLDGKKATTNKMAWPEITAMGMNVDWISQARWVTDGNTWTSSGVSAGIDLIFAWIAAVFSEETAESIANGMEYSRQKDSRYDPFAALHGLK